MGVVRLFLALSVVVSHSSPIFGFYLVPGDLAVQAFYLISGFYISLVLGRKYSLDKNGITRFYINRFLRLAPGYWVVVLLTLITYYVTKNPYFEFIKQISPASIIWVVFTNIFIVALDTFMFLKVSLAGTFQFTSNFAKESFGAYGFIVVRQAWSLGLELWFYILAPLLVAQKSGKLLTICVASLILRVVLSAHGLNHDPWTYRFFPNEVVFFVSGILLNRLFFKIKDRVPSSVGLTAFWLIIIFLLTYSKTSGTSIWHILFLISVAAAIPFIFEWSKNNAVDRLVGELSYPVYICHLLVFYILTKYPALVFGKSLGTIGACYSLIFGAILYFCVDRPFDRIRHSLLLKK